MDYSLSGSSIHGIFQARVLQWGAIAFSMAGTSWCYCLNNPSKTAGTGEAVRRYPKSKGKRRSPTKTVQLVQSLSHVQLFVTPWTVAQQAPPSMGFSRQEYWSGLPFPSPYPASWETIKMKCFRYRHTHLIHKPHIPFFC